MKTENQDQTEDPVRKAREDREDLSEYQADQEPWERLDRPDLVDPGVNRESVVHQENLVSLDGKVHLVLEVPRVSEVSGDHRDRVAQAGQTDLQVHPV